jgi:hypothetical protein
MKRRTGLVRFRTVNGENLSLRKSEYEDEDEDEFDLKSETDLGETKTEAALYNGQPPTANRQLFGNRQLFCQCLRCRGIIIRGAGGNF